MPITKEVIVKVPEFLLARTYQATGKTTIAEALETLLVAYGKDGSKVPDHKENKQCKNMVHCYKYRKNTHEVLRKGSALKSNSVSIIPYSIEDGVKKSAAPHNAKYHCRIFDEWISANSLWEIWAGAIDKMFELDPAVIARLQAKHSPRGTRRYCADRPEDVHVGSPHLITEVKRTRCGKYISSNFNEKGCRHNLGVLCEVAGLEWGKDMDFIAT